VKLSEILEKLKEFPDMFLGDETVNALDIYLNGYCAGSSLNYREHIKKYAPGSLGLNRFDDLQEAIDAALKGARDAEEHERVFGRDPDVLRRQAEEVLLAYDLTSQSFKWYASRYLFAFQGYPITSSSGSDDEGQVVGVMNSIHDAEFIELAHELMPVFAKMVLDLVNRK